MLPLPEGEKSTESRSPRYHVYLSFDDQSQNFARNIFLCLSVVGIHTFMREGNSHEGEAKWDTLVRAIDSSNIGIVVLSEMYADSILCLNELSKIVKREHGYLLPVLYDVKRTDVRVQTGTFGDRFASRIREEDPVTACRWKEALKVIGNHFVFKFDRKGNESECSFIRRLIHYVSSQLDSRKMVHAPQFLVEIKSIQNAIFSLLDLDNNDVFMVGICGMGGIGKTAMAKAIYAELARSFERHFFLANVREICKQHLHDGLFQLQLKLLSSMLSRVLDISHTQEASNLIKERFCLMKTLLIIDDVDHLEQLEALAGARQWFGPGSRIIITTREMRLLHAHGVKKVYEAPLLEKSDAYLLFNATFSRGRRDNIFFRDLTKLVMDYAKGLPLAITVMASFLRGKSKSESANILKVWEGSPPPEILSILRQSYDSLTDEEKDIFLDIACFFKGQPVSYVKRIVECCYSYPDHSMRVLQDKFLISIKKDKVAMHEMLQKMGMEIVRQNSQDNPSYHRRLWDRDDILNILSSNKGTVNVKSIKLELVASKEVSFNSDALKGLRVLIAHNAHPGDPINLPEGVTWLEWPEYKFSSLPFHNEAGRKLVGLHMSKSNIQLRENDLKPFRKLKFINFSYSTSLRFIPDLSSLANLESLDVEGCKTLVEVHQSLGELTKLVHLNFLNCENLHTFPFSLRPSVLQDLILKGCSKLTKFPDIEVEVRNLKELSLSETGIDELPSSMKNLIGLKELYLENCKNLEIPPSSIYILQSLQRVFLDGCSELHEFPVYADRSNKSSATSMPKAFPAMVNLELQRCGIKLIDFIEDFGCVSTLKKLDLSGSKLITIPKCIDKFIILEQLNLANCKQLRNIRGLPPNIKYLFARGCKSLERCVSLSSILKSHSDESPWLRKIDFSGCDKLTQNESSVACLLSIEDSFEKSQIKILHPGSEIPMWFGYRSEEGSLSFSVDSRLYQKITGLAFCVVIGLPGKTTASFSCEFQVYINGQKTYDTAEFLHPLDSDHLWLVYVPCAWIGGWEAKMRNMHNEFKVQFDLSRGNLKCCGVHLVLKKDETNENINGVDTVEDDE